MISSFVSVIEDTKDLSLSEEKQRSPQQRRHSSQRTLPATPRRHLRPPSHAPANKHKYRQAPNPYIYIYIYANSRRTTTTTTSPLLPNRTPAELEANARQFHPPESKSSETSRLKPKTWFRFVDDRATNAPSQKHM